jgi:hypothetical protein
MNDRVFTDDDYALAYPPGIEHHFWTQTRVDILDNLIRSSNLHTKKMLEIGCGKGIMVRELRMKVLNCFGADLANVTAPGDISSFVFLNQDACLLDQSFRDSVEVILLLDVIEHIEFVKPFLENIQKAFINAKWFIVMVPARKEFWSNYDVYYGHFRRYDLAMMVDLAASMNYQVSLNRFFFHALYFTAYVLFRLSGKREIRGFAPKGWAKPLHRLLAWAFYIESRLLPASLPGSSIVTLLKKN